MVSLVDLTTTAFQANVVLAVIFGAGYVFGKKTSATVSKVLVVLFRYLRIGLG